VTNLNADASHLFDLVFAQAWVPLLAYITRGADIIFGAQGNDSINAGAGGDHVYGGGGADVIKGQTGGDALFGGAGNDILIGGNGSDTLTGGLGADKFDFAVLADATGADRIADFKHGVDHFVLHAATIAGIGGPGPLDPSHFSGVAITPATVILYDQATGWISYDADGSGLGGAWASIHVANGTVLDASDFLVV
jgi:Ca2+-binding RTX toxin-like protein